ncbi:hypothetical protein BDF22DRAFT_676663 [Syncephalis plumigaleata]|nr:hypothetical protein BDF22DRAFT_676663 [Syncephalis plumigaleata]
MPFYFRHKVNSIATATHHLMEFDSTSLLLPEPDVHPFVLNEQSIPANVRRPGESAIYRSKMVPHGGPLPMFPNSQTRTLVDDMLGIYMRNSTVTAHRNLPAILSICPECPTVRWIIISDQAPSEENSDRAQRLGITLETFTAVENIGALIHARKYLNQVSNTALISSSTCTSKPDDLACICFTCGTSGEPRGVMLTHAVTHVFEHTLVLAIMSVGGQNLRMMEKSAQVVKPTILPMVPHILNRIREAVEKTVKQSQLLYRRAINAKSRWLNEGRVVNNSWWDSLILVIYVLTLVSVRIIPCGAAPITTDTLDWARAFFGCPVIEGYDCAAIAATHPNDYQHPYGTCVGLVLPVNEIKLVDIPELRYYASDTPNPRGEICVRGGSVTKGYYGRPEDTRAILSEDGWLRTGDVGEMLPNGTLKVIDRKKNVCKLSQGEYVAPAKIESIYENCDLISQVYVHVDPLQHYLVAVVIPDAERIQEVARERQLDTNLSLSELCNNETIRNAILECMHDKGCEHELSRYEQVRRIIYILNHSLPTINC